MAYNNLGGILKMQGRAAEAISCYEHVALLQPNSPEVWHSRQRSDFLLVESFHATHVFRIPPAGCHCQLG